MNLNEFSIKGLGYCILKFLRLLHTNDFNVKSSIGRKEPKRLFGRSWILCHMLGTARMSANYQEAGRSSTEATITLWPSEIAYLDSDGRFMVSRDRLRDETRYYRARRSCKRRVRCQCTARRGVLGHRHHRDDHCSSLQPL